jgi:hypothetical protein
MSSHLLYGLLAVSLMGIPTSDAVASAGRARYVDPTHGFSIRHPTGFVIQPQDVARFAQFSPKPVASVFFMNPAMAAGALAGIEPPDLDVRVYDARAVDSLEAWLVAVGLASADSVAAARPFRNASVDGLEVCRSTMIAPACSFYVLRKGRVYQLTPMSVEGEAMARTFALPP